MEFKKSEADTAVVELRRARRLGRARKPVGAVSPPRRRRAVIVVGAIFLILVAVVWSGTALMLGGSVNGEPGTIHVLGRSYNRYAPCCETGVAYFGGGPTTLARARDSGIVGPGDPVVVRLAGAPLGWLGVAEPVKATDLSPSTVLLQEGPDAYYPYQAGTT